MGGWVVESIREIPEPMEVYAKIIIINNNNKGKHFKKETYNSRR